MSALAAVGVVASAAQLAAYGKSILLFIANTYGQIQGAPEEYYEYGVQLKLLTHLAQIVEKTPALQNPDVQYHLDASLVEVKALQAILCSPTSGFAKRSGPRHYWRLITGTEQNEILVHLDRLNKKNHGLLLCINAVNTNQISSVQGSVDKLVEMNTACLERQEEITKENQSTYTTGWNYGLPKPPLENDYTKALVVVSKPQELEAHLHAPTHQMPHTVFGEITITGKNVMAEIGDENKSHSPNGSDCNCTSHPTDNTGSEFKLVSIKAGIVHTGETGRPRGCQFHKVVVEGEDEGDIKTRFKAGGFGTSELKDTWFEKQIEREKKARDFEEYRRMQAEGFEHFMQQKANGKENLQIGQ
jgi:hypothetical protein